MNRYRRFGDDELRNLQLLHISLNYPNSIRSAPEVQVIGFENTLVLEIKKIFNVANSNRRILLQYDTTFNMTDYYVSILNFMHPFLFKNNSNISPPIPFGEYFHEKKYEESHEEFWRFTKKLFPEIEDKAVIITDCEAGIRSAIRKIFPNVPLLR